MKTLQHLALPLALLSFLSAHAHSNEVLRCQITVTTADGQPIPAATIESYRLPDSRADADPITRPGARAYTDTGGKASFILTNRASLLFIANKPGLSLGWATWYSRWPGLDSEDQSFEISLSARMSISGVVRDAGGHPVGGAMIWVSRASRPGARGDSVQSWIHLDRQLGTRYLGARSASDGKFRIEGLPADATLDLTAAKPGLVLDESLHGTLSSGGLSFQAGQSDIVLTVGPAGAVAGRIVRDDTGTGLPGARVFIGEGFWNTGREPSPADPNGFFTLPDLSPGDHTLRAVAGTNQFAEWVCEPVSVTVEAGVTNRNVQFRATRGAVLKIIVLDQQTSKPLPGAGVWISHESSAQSASASDGGIAWLRAAPGDFRVGVTSEGHASYQSEVILERGQTNELTVTLETAPRIQGTVVDPEGRPAPGVRVTSYPVQQSEKKTDVSGHFAISFDPNQFGGPRPSPRVFIARDLSHNLAVAREVEPDATNATLKLEQALTLAGQVTDSKGKAIPNAEAQVMFRTENMSSPFGSPVRADARGRFELKGLPPGRQYSVVVSAKGFGTESRQVEAQGSSRRIELEPFQLSQADQRIAGRVVDSDDKPVPGARINMSGDKQPNLSVRADAHGRFSLDHVCAGDINLYAYPVRGGAGGSIVARAGDTNITIRFGDSQSAAGGGGLTRLAGVVLGPDGKPAPKVTIALLPNGGAARQTDAEGRFNLRFSRNQWESQQPSALVARDFSRNLAVAADVEPGVTNLELKLERALTLAGSITDTKEKPVTNGQARLTFWTGNTGSSLGEPVRADVQGRFEIKALPVGRRYGVDASAKGYGRENRNIDVTETETENRRLDLPAFQLTVADLSVAGAVLDSDDKAVAGASVNGYGERQPSVNGRTDSKGRFSFDQLTAGQIHLSAHDPRGGSYGSVIAEAGDTNIVVQFGITENSGRPGTVVRIRGMVTDRDGKPAPRVQVRLLGGSQAEKQTDTEGRFRMAFSLNEWGGSQPSPRILIARDLGRNLAATLELDQEATNADVRLEPALTLVGRAVGPNGKPVPNAEIQVMLSTEHLSSTVGSNVRADAEGRFQITGLPPGARYSVSVWAKGFGREKRDVESTYAGLQRLELEPFHLPAAELQIAGVVLDADDKPVPGASINLSGDNQSGAWGRADAKGHFSFTQLSAGEVRLYANHPQGGPGGYGSLVVQAGDTNITLQLGVSQSSGGSGEIMRLSGTVFDLEGKPAPKVRLSLFPFHSGEKQSDADGRFKLTFNPREWGRSEDNSRILVARDLVRNLATAVEVEQDAATRDVKLEKGFTVAGRATDTNGNPILRAEAQVTFRSDRMSSSLGPAVRVNSEGRFEIKALPPGCRYEVSVSAKGFGRETKEVEPAQADAPRLELEPFELVVADRHIAGTVLDIDDKPVIGAWVSVYGARQPSLSGQTDAKGRFAFDQVCSGALQLSVNSQRGGFASASAEGGDTNIIVRLNVSPGMRLAPPRRASLKGRPLPDLAALGSMPVQQLADGPVLAVLVDLEQRPSRRILQPLAEKFADLNQKHVSVLVLEAGSMPDDAFAAWTKEAGLPFPLVRLKGDREKARSAWGAGALPWLVLADSERRVMAEGFTLDELEARVKAIAK